MIVAFEIGRGKWRDSTEPASAKDRKILDQIKKLGRFHEPGEWSQGNYYFEFEPNDDKSELKARRLIDKAAFVWVHR